MELFHIGRILKAHGKDGYLRIQCEDNAVDVLPELRAIFIDIDGSKVPFLIEDFQIKNHFLIKLDEVDSPEEASEHSLRDIYIDMEEVEDKSLFASQDEMNSELIGFDVYNQEDKFIGTVSDFIDNEFQQLLSVESKGRSFLIPFHEDLLLKFEADRKRIYLEIPEGLTDLD